MRDLVEYEKSFVKNNFEIWKDRFTWKGLYGDEKYSTFTILKFLKTIDLSNIEWNTTLEFYNWIVKISDEYLKFAKTKKKSLSEKELKKIRDFFIGALGEFFFVNVLKNCRVFAIDKTKYIFDNVSLTYNIEDYGIDACCRLSFGNTTENAVIQIKFWNPFSDEKMTTEIVEKAFAQGILENFIDFSECTNDSKPIVICWLGTKDNVSTYLTKYSKLRKLALIIDRTELQKNVDNLDNIFWKETLKKELLELVEK